MSEDRATINRLIGLLLRVPVHMVDIDAANRTGDHAALAYTKAITAWRREAVEAIQGTRESRPVIARYHAPYVAPTSPAASASS